MTMSQNRTMIDGRGERSWPGKFLERPGIMTQGESLEARQQKLRDAWHAMVMPGA
jgi:predicted RNase H-like HicB family nuclease